MSSSLLSAAVDRSFSCAARKNSRLVLGIWVVLIVCLMLCQSLVAQENFLVATEDGVLSLYDLATYSPIESFQNEPFTYTVTSSPNQRLAFMAGGSGYGSAVDMTIERAITSLTGVRGSTSTIGYSGNYYLVSDYNTTLDVVDTATLMMVRTVDLSSVLPLVGLPGGIVAANDQAYVLPRGQSSEGIAVVNLANFQLSSIPVPAGSFCRLCAARVPDDSIVVVVERENSDGKTHVLLINTTTKIISDVPQAKNYGVSSVVVTPNGSGPLYGYVFSSSSGSVMTLDLRPNSPTYGQILANTAVAIPNLSLSGMAINSDGSRVIVVGSPTVQPPAPNVAVVDTVNQVLATQLTVNGGITADAVCTGFFSTTPPPTAPTVTGLSTYQITNDQSNDIAITGTNFQPGALVGIGGFPPLPSNFLGSTMLSVTVPAGAPAGRALDIIVTNPLTNDPPDQQNQSGLLAGKFNILPTPKFQPTTQFATSNSVVPYVYDLKQQTMVGIPTGYPGDTVNGLAFNVDGKALYLASLQSYSGAYYVLPVNLSTNTPDSPITLPSNTYTISQLLPLAAGLDPEKGTPVIYVAWTDDTDLHLGKIDSDSASPTYNTIVETFNAGLNGDYPYAETMTLRSDGKYAYVWYYKDNYSLGIFNLATGAFNSVAADTLRVSESQSQIGISPDGKSMLLAAFYGNRTRIRIFDIANPTNPKPVTVITPIPIPRWGFPQVVNYQVIGNKLYAIDLYGAVVVFNFDRAKGDFRERGYVASDHQENYTSYVFSPDGSYMYVTDYFGDLVLVLDTSKLIGGTNPALTQIRSPYTPYLIDVSPVAPPAKSPSLKQRGKQQRTVPDQNEFRRPTLRPE